MKTTNIVLLVLFIFFANLCVAQNWEDTKNGMDFSLNGSKYIVKENCKRIAISSFNIGYVLTAKGQNKWTNMDVEITGMSHADIQQLTDKIYEQFVEKWKAAGYEIVDKKAMMNCKVLAKDVEKGNVKAGGSSSPAFMLQAGNLKKLEETFDVSYFVPTGIPDYGQEKVPMIQPGKISKELNAIVLDITFVFNTIDFKSSESHSRGTVTQEINATTWFSTSSSGISADNTYMNTHVNINYTSPKGFIAIGTVIIKQGVSGEAKFVSDTKQESIGEGSNANYVNAHVKRNYVTTPETFGNETREWCGGFMDVLIKRFKSTIEGEK